MRRFPCAMDSFAWGVLFASFYVDRSGELPRLKHLAWIGYAGLLVIAASYGLFAWADYHHELEQHPTHWYYEWSRWLPGLGAFLTLFFAFDGQSRGNRLLAAPSLRFVGIASYEWFLIHQPVFYFARELAGSTHGNVFLYSLTVGTPLVGTFLLSVAVYHYFSLPIMRRGRTKLGSKH
jgi:peptidoglycan/LPS O-acetylase OafA/YrhL